MRPLEQLEAGQWELVDPDGAPLTPVPTDESKRCDPPNPYCISKLDQEQLALSFGRMEGLEVVALRYFLTYGPRQSPSNPYTGVIAIFATRVLNGERPMVYEDGLQTRDFVHVRDVAAATVVALEHPEASGRAYNVGTGVATPIAEVARKVAAGLGRRDLTPKTTGSFRPLDIRHLVGDSSAMRALGWAPVIGFADGLTETLKWLRKSATAPAQDVLAGLRSSGIVRGGGGALAEGPIAQAGLPAEGREKDGADHHHTRVSVVVPAFDEAGNIERMVGDCLRYLPTFTRAFEVIVVDDGSRDGTREICERLAREDDRVRAIHHPFNLGYGAAQKSGFLAARYDWVALVPGDNQFDIRDLASYLAARHDADVIGGVRQDRKERWDRRWASSLFNRYMRATHGVTLTDINWVKLYRRSLLDQITLETPGFSADAEVIVKLAALGARMKELRVQHLPRTWGEETHVSVRTITHTAMELLRLPSKLKRLKVRR